MTRSLLPALLVIFASCATTGSTWRSGVGDRQLEHPPYYAGRPVSGLAEARIAHFPVAFQRGASQAEMFEPASDAQSAIAAFVDEMNAFLDSMHPSGRLSAASGQGSVPPNVYFGCELDASFDCVERGDSVLGRQGTTMRLAVERPSGAWIARAAEMLDSADATHALVLTLEVGQYWTRQSGLLGRKSVELGTNYVVPVPWVTSLETPVSVIQLTGALIDREGQAVRIGAEGILAQRTPIVASGFGMQRLISEEDVERARSLRHDDRPGQPLVWRSALCALLAQLTGSGCSTTP
ncbi:MAG TPA: hypothetical protein VFZ73_01070 [Gemmatimonadaceae bacterium]